MKKQILVALMTLVPAIGFAKIQDFNALISENVKAQKELHKNVQTNVEATREQIAAQSIRERIVIVENSGESYNAPTRKDLLAFKKEQRSHRASEKKQFDRLASEISSLQD